MTTSDCSTLSSAASSPASEAAGILPSSPSLDSATGLRSVPASTEVSWAITSARLLPGAGIRSAAWGAEGCCTGTAVKAGKGISSSTVSLLSSGDWGSL